MKKTFAFGLALLGMAASSPAQTVNTLVPASVGLSEPYGVAASEDNQLIYLTDGANHRVIKYNTTSGEVTSMGGRLGDPGAVDGTSAQSRFFDPKGIIAARGGLVVADAGNHVLRFINVTNKTTITIAGALGQGGNVSGASNVARFLSPRGLALHSNGNIYVTDFQAHSVRIFDTNNNVSTLAVSGLSGPAGIAIANNGDAYVADRTDHTIKLVSPSGTVTTIAGISGEAGSSDAIDGLEATFNHPEGALWLGGTFGLLVTDTDNHTLRRVYFNDSTGGWSVETYSGLAGTPGTTDGTPANARYKTPAGLTAFSTGFLVVDDGNKTVRQVLVTSTPPKIAEPQIGYVTLEIDPQSGSLVTHFTPVTDTTFNNAVVVGIIGASGVSHHFTFGAGRTNILQPDPVIDPTILSPTAPEFTPGGPPDTMPQTIAPPLRVLAVKSFSAAEGRTSSAIVEAIFRFQVATPLLDLASTPGSLTFKNGTTNSTIYYTIDGSDPTENKTENPATFGPFLSGEKIPLNIKTNTTFRARAFLQNFQQSRLAILELSPTNFIPNVISLGFSNGEASSEFKGSPGQSFTSPVTMNILPNQTMYGLQFNLSVTNNSSSAPVGVYNPQFHSFLIEPLPAQTFRVIDPKVFVQLINVPIVIDMGSNIFVTNFVTQQIFQDLVTVGMANNFLTVGWLERYGRTNLYNTLGQHLIMYSQAHDTLFESKNRKVVVGAFTFTVPTNSAPADKYKVQVQRPSATADGIRDDVLIETPDGTDPLIPVSAKRDLEILDPGPRYLVGDAVPFRWFNAGDFGDTNLLNNDIIQAVQSAVYGLNTPPAESDMFDALDSCCHDANDVAVVTGNVMYTPNATLNGIAYGDKVLNMSDIYLTFRRSLDPSLSNYFRYWSGGKRVAEPTENLFRGSPVKEAESLPAIAASFTPNPELEAEPIGVKFSAPALRGKAGEVLRAPVTMRISGTTPVRSLLMRLSVTSLDGASHFGSTPTFTPAAVLGNPTFGGPSGSGYAGAWFDMANPLPAGEYVVGTIEFSIPVNTGADALYSVQIDHAEASPNGIAQLPVTTENGYVIMENRVFKAWNDEISDAWRIQYFGSLVNILSAPNADADGDGMTNLQEYRAGTNPTDINSRFVIRGERSPIGDFAIILNWPSEAGKKYRLEGSATVISDAWTVIEDSITGTGNLMERPVNQDGGMRFFRVNIIP